MYEPPANCRDIPSDAVPEWSLNASRTCLLPDTDYGNGSAADMKKGQPTNANIHSCFHCKGSLLTLSFMVQEADAIKCYLYWNGQMTRFIPEGAKTVLSAIFNTKRTKTSEIGDLNQRFLKGEQRDSEKTLDEMINFMKKKIKDSQFKSFCEFYGNETV